MLQMQLLFLAEGREQEWADLDWTGPAQGPEETAKPVEAPVEALWLSSPFQPVLEVVEAAGHL